MKQDATYTIEVGIIMARTARNDSMTHIINYFICNNFEVKNFINKLDY